MFANRFLKGKDREGVKSYCLNKILDVYRDTFHLWIKSYDSTYEWLVYYPRDVLKYRVLYINHQT